jgi:hypothetical protein
MTELTQIPDERDCFSGEQYSHDWVNSPDLLNEQVLFIITKEGGVAPYSHEFASGGSDPQILSGFVSAMGSFMGEVTGSSQNRWKTVYGPDSTLIVEGGNWCIGVIAVNRETSEVRSKLRRVVQEFEEAFEFLRDAQGIEGGIFEEFDHFVRRVFITDRLSERSILLKGEDWFSQCKRFELPSIAFKITRMLYFAKTGDSLGYIAKQMKHPLDEVKELVSRVIWRNAVNVVYAPSNQEILAPSENALCTLLDSSNPQVISTETMRVVGALDGRAQLSTVYDSVQTRDKPKVCSELGKLLNRGYIQRISIERKLVLAKECMLCKLLELTSQHISKTHLMMKIDDAFKKGTNSHPWLARIRISSELIARCLFEDGMAPSDLDSLHEALDYLIKVITTLIQRRLNKQLSSSLLSQVQETCNEKWLPRLWDTMI